MNYSFNMSKYTPEGHEVKLARERKAKELELIKQMEEQQRKEKEKERLEEEYKAQLAKEKAELERIKSVEVARLEAIARERKFIEDNWPLPPGF